MPLEIRELVIKVRVGNSQDGQGGAASPATGADTGAGTETIVNLCVEKVLEILKDKAER